MTTVEALASGKPVIAYRAGGATEIITEGITGTFFNDQTPQCLVDAIKKFRPDRYNPKLIRQDALRFDEAYFKRKMKEFVEQSFLDYKK